MGYLHAEVTIRQSPKRPGHPCGDLVRVDRTAAATTIICADGIGSGVKANLAAQMAVSRLGELIAGGFSFRRAFGRVVAGMEDVRSAAQVYPYAVLSAAQVLGDGSATTLTYEMPPPLLVGGRSASVVRPRSVPSGRAVIGEATFDLAPGEGLLMVSDGITQAGLGNGLSDGWQAEAVARFITDRLGAGDAADGIALAVHDRARQLWSPLAGDDCTVAAAFCREGTVLNILTGPPSSRQKDAEVAKRFLGGDGLKVICGASTAGLVARQLGRSVEVDQDSQSLIAPPQYVLEGVDLVTEGAVTLNQVYNVLGEDSARFEEVSGVTQICQLLQVADRVNFIVGLAANPANSSITFRQRGIINRRNIVPLIAQKLVDKGKLVVVEYV